MKPGLRLSFEVIEDAAAVLPEKSAEAIVCSSVIEYVTDADGLLRQFKAALRSNGLLFISFANATSYIRKQWERDAASNPMGPVAQHVWTWPQFRALLERNGFEARIQPLYFESRWDAYSWGKWLRRSAHIGTLGLSVVGGLVVLLGLGFFDVAGADGGPPEGGAVGPHAFAGEGAG